MTKERESQIDECKELLIRLERWIALDKFVRHQNGRRRGIIGDCRISMNFGRCWIDMGSSLTSVICGIE
jgi:hypothetical protein